MNLLCRLFGHKHGAVVLEKVMPDEWSYASARPACYLSASKCRRCGVPLIHAHGVWHEDKRDEDRMPVDPAPAGE